MHNMKARFNSFPKKVQNEIKQRFDELFGTGQYECSDNYRYARTGSFEEMEAYEEIEHGGCCGSFNEEITIDGVTYIFGFNYGH